MIIFNLDFFINPLHGLIGISIMDFYQTMVSLPMFFSIGMGNAKLLVELIAPWKAWKRSDSEVKTFSADKL